MNTRRTAILIMRARRAEADKDQAGLERADPRMNAGDVRGGELVLALASRGIDVEMRVARRRRDATRHAREAAKAGTELVVVGGGDRTVTAVARGLADSKTVLGIVPLGAKRNSVASRLGVPDAIEAACDLLAQGAAHTIDVGLVNAAVRTAPEHGWWGGPPATQGAQRTHGRRAGLLVIGGSPAARAEAA